MIRIKRTGDYNSMLESLCFGNPDMFDLVRRIIILFENNPEDTRLDNHELTGKMEGKWAFSITDDVRIVYEKIGKNYVRFLAIGGHCRVYYNQ